MSGDSETPPTYYFSGITFNPTFYTATTSGNYLTATTGKKYFLSYPTAQGDETISRLYTSQVSTPTPTDAFNFLDSLTGNLYIGENASGTTGQIIQIGAKTLTTVKLGALSIKESTIDTLAPSTAFSILGSQTAGITIGGNVPTGQIIQIGQAATAAKVYASNISFDNNSINHATNNTTGVVNLCNAQSDGNGQLNIGTHNSRAGPINIGTGFSSTAAINLGAITGTTSANTINIGILTPNAITIGHAVANVTINSSSGSIRTPSITTGTLSASGLITANNGITIPTGKTLTATGGIVVSSIDTPASGTMAIGASSTGGITLGAGNASTTVAGGLTVTGQITANAGLALSGNFGISLPTQTTAPTIGQLGYTVNLLTSSGITNTGTANQTTQVASVASLPVGTYIFFFSGYSNSNSATYTMGMNNTSALFDAKYTSSASVLGTAFTAVKVQMTVIIQNTSVQTWYLNHSASVATFPANFIYWYYTRIA
jgi:hypothetical protein